MNYRMVIVCTVPSDPSAYNPDRIEKFSVDDGGGHEDERAIEIAQGKVAEIQSGEKFGKEYFLEEVQRIIFPPK